MTALQSSFWWNRSDRPAHLEAVIFSLDALLADTRADERLLAEAVWDLHCAGIRVAVITSGHWPAVHRPVRELLGDGAVEVRGAPKFRVRMTNRVSYAGKVPNLETRLQWALTA